MAKKKPDQVADNPNILPYASNVGAPVIKPTDLTSFKQEKILKTNSYFKSKYEEIKKEYQDLIDSYELNKLIYNCKFSFKPEKGEIYHLYQRNDEKLFLSNHSIFSELKFPSQQDTIILPKSDLSNGRIV